MDEMQQLKKLVEAQEKQIQALKKAITVLEQKLHVVNATATRAKHQSAHLQEQVRGINSTISKIGKSQ